MSLEKEKDDEDDVSKEGGEMEEDREKIIKMEIKEEVEMEEEMFEEIFEEERRGKGQSSAFSSPSVFSSCPSHTSTNFFLRRGH